MEFLSLIRIKHWIKNLFVFVPLVFAKKLGDTVSLTNAVTLFFLFSFVASIIYVFNDIHDREKDKFHPIKKNRPIASGKISIRLAVVIIFILTFAVIIIAMLSGLPINAVELVTAYFVINIFYTLKLKQIPILDILTISSGYVLRVYAGAFAIGVPVSQWLIVTVLFLSLFLATLKRGAEFRKAVGNGKTREVLSQYSSELINLILTVAVTGVIMSYLLYSISDKIYAEIHSYNFVITAIFPIYGLFRILLLYYKNEQGEDIIEILVKDFPSLLNLFLYGITVLYLIY